ncbi:MAG: carboxypeptidase-like regulatory domain-containing protein [Chitinophagaceae bacterium]|nr:carboxypeptidase-like regulatory domain-containing protein [Chitinophagaceae bacterium]
MKYNLFIFLFFCNTAVSQTSISGVVINGSNNSKLPAASIFINNSTKGTIGNNDGTFTVTGITETNFELVISYTGFATISLKITPENIAQYQTIKMFPRKQELQEVSVLSADKDGWEKWGKMFTNNFIGTSDFALECHIENPEVLRFFYNKTNGILTAYSHGNLIIHNKALGYDIRYQLEEFVSDPVQHTITYVGYTGFEDLNTKNQHTIKKWNLNRQEAYMGSIMHFMRSLYSGTTSEAGFEVREKIIVNKNDPAFAEIYRNGNIPLFVKIDSMEYNTVAAKVYNKEVPAYIDLICTKPFPLKNMVLYDSISHEAEFYFVNHLRIVYKNAKEKNAYLLQNFRPQSQRTFQTSEIYLTDDEVIKIESNGLYFDPVNVITSGYWGWNKMAETLPADFRIDQN